MKYKEEIYKEALEIWNMFITATQQARLENKYDYQLQMDETTLVELLKKAYPSLKDKKSHLHELAKEILNS